MLEHKAQYLRTIFDTIPLPTFIVDEDVRIEDFNTAAEQFLGPEPATALHRRGGEVLHCINSEPYGCGRHPLCEDCVIRESVRKAITGRRTCRKMHQAELRTGTGVVPIDLLVTTSLLPYTERPRVIVMLEDVSEIVRLRAIQPPPPHRHD